MKKILASAILFFAVIVLSSASEPAGFNIAWRGLTWDASLSNVLPVDEKNKVISYLNNQFRQILASSGISDLSAASFSDDAASEASASAFKYAILPVITVFRQIESEKSGTFFSCEIKLTIQHYSGEGAGAYLGPGAVAGEGAGADAGTDSIAGTDAIGNRDRVFYLKHIGSGEDSGQAMQKSLEGIVDQFEFLLVEFEEWSDSFRVIDIYQGTVIINSGKNDGLCKGDFLHSFDPWQSGKVTGDFVVEKTDTDISYARILKVKQYPKAGDPLFRDDFIGFSLTVYTDYFSGEIFSGFISGADLLWRKGLYVFHPLAGLKFLDIKDENDASIAVLIPYAGFQIVRHIGSMTFSSMLSAGAGCVSDSSLYSGKYSGWQYKGGTVKAKAERRMGRRFSVFAEAGYSYWYSSDVTELPDIAGFLAGGGVSVKF
ncbi:MAG: hypothetical protein RBT69_06600 [Spirochaetia bacterium]|nr:hypothetical protein [Spirochaetia bacterium]